MQSRKCTGCSAEYIVARNSDKKKFCSSSCAAKQNNKGRVLSSETRNKIRKTINEKIQSGVISPKKASEARWKGRIQKPKSLIICKNCLKQVYSQNTTFCSDECKKSFWKQNLIIDGYDGKLKEGTLRKFVLFTREYKCEIPHCGISEWHGQPAPLEIDHIDGDSSHNLPNNIRLICGNCHAQTSTYRAKNMGKGRPNRYCK